METLYITSILEIPLAELRFKFNRSSGPGGQNVNKLNTRAELQYNFAQSAVLSALQRQRIAEKLSARLNSEGLLIVNSERFRTQGRNREDCLDKLSALLAEAIKPPPPKRRKTKPGRAARARRLDGKKRHSEKKKSRRRPLSD
ncbi:MAG: alternative ribosome rescue aminoacyl-tRNA hydrolase ArfB [Candidatus Latescibacterota bacterium]|nr:alternative ribosome rescue aminoacyl-tRNA hydrolase ArfB [Candidatus Latescibacterota bacterium]